jgi:hypothetical protein
LTEAFEYYEKQRAGLGGEFLDEVEAAFERIRLNPTAWARVEGDIRRCRTKRFPYGVIYRVKLDTIEIIAVMHLHREPNYWKNRI